MAGTPRFECLGSGGRPASATPARVALLDRCRSVLPADEKVAREKGPLESAIQSAVCDYPALRKHFFRPKGLAGTLVKRAAGGLTFFPECEETRGARAEFMVRRGTRGGVLHPLFAPQTLPRPSSPI